MAIELVYETHSSTEDNEHAIATGWLPGRLSASGREHAADFASQPGWEYVLP